MSRPTMNMLRTRRKDNNVKPNRRLDRKSSRGMLYENEELRLKTININAEVESRQSDIKKLKRENEMLKKGLWYLRDEYDKLEKLIKDKKIDFSSSSTCSTSNDSDSCSSCSEESEEVETTQNMKNVQRTNLRNIQDQFEQLSVVTEETSAENSERSIPRDNWNKYEENVIQPDQSYPIYQNLEKSEMLPHPDNVHFFSPIQPSQGYEEPHYAEMQDNIVYPPLFSSNQYTNLETSINNENVDDFQHSPNCEHYLNQKSVQPGPNHFYQNMVLVPQTTKPPPQAKTMEKSLTDLIVKIDNQNFNKGIVFSNTPSQSTFSNGGNLEELLNDIESISQRGVSNHIIQAPDALYHHEDPKLRRSSDSNVNATSDHHLVNGHEKPPEKPFKSELNVVLVPNPMPLITLDKYKNIQRSFENINSKPLEELSVSQQDLRLIPPPPPFPQSHSPELLTKTQSAPVVNVISTPGETDKNPFFFGNLKDNYVNSNFFSTQYNPDSFLEKPEDNKNKGKPDQNFGSKSNLLDLTSSEQISSENEENLKFRTTASQPEEKKLDQSKENKKSPMTIRKKVSIHFKGKSKKTPNGNSDPAIQRPTGEKKHSLFDLKFGDKDKDKNKATHQKTPSIESKKSTTETSNQEPKTPTSSDSKTSNEKKPCSTNKKDQSGEKKLRKSVSISPERSKHVQLAEEGGVKKHKKHKKSDRARMRRQASVAEPRNFRERSFSVCTDRSGALEHRLGLGLGFGSSFFFDDYSERERTNSLSSCNTAEHARKMSELSNVPLSGKVPWCGCWGNGCL